MARTPTHLYCPECKNIQPCRVADDPTTKGYTGESGKRWQDADFPDIRWYRRVRVCDMCGHTFATAEIEEAFVTELRRLRRTVSELRGKIEEHDVATTTTKQLLDRAKQSLDELTTTLGILINT